jgi:hypothetical protein
MKKPSKKTASSSSAPIDESTKLIAQATKAIGPVQRLTPLDRIRSAKIRRGGHQVVPLIATVATKYGIDAPNISGDALSASLAHVQSLDALLSATTELHATISDVHFSASNGMWSSARSLYAMLKAVATTNASIATELHPVEEWFRYRKPAAPQADATAATTPATAVASTSANEAPVATTSADEAPAAVVAPAAASAVTSIVAKAPTPVTAPTTG